MATVKQGPFVIREEPDRKLAIATFAANCYQNRTTTDEEQLARLVDRFDNVACDLTLTEAIASDWLRWIARLSTRAKKVGKRVFLVGVKEQVLKTSDLLGLKEELTIVKTLAEGLAL
jgi:anti-anti-sigma regulatory factor